jgi:hypothetical protein
MRMDRFTGNEMRQEDARLYQELNTSMNNSDQLVWKVLVIQIVLIIIGTSFNDTAATLGRLGIVVGFAFIATQCMYASKIHRIGSYFKDAGSVWENAPRSPFVGIFGTMLLMASMILWVWNIVLWYPTRDALFTDNSLLNVANFVTLVLIALTGIMVILLPLIPGIEARYNKTHSKPASFLANKDHPRN